MMSQVLFDTPIYNPTLWVIAAIIFILAYNYLTKESWKNLPPGPPALPLIGSLPFLGWLDIREPLRKLARKYGDVFTIYLGPTRVVILNGYDAIWDAFVKHANVFSGRPNNYISKKLTKGHGKQREQKCVCCVCCVVCVCVGGRFVWVLCIVVI